ncbi:MAG: helix-turn-helix transcriptional regulator [Mobilitalea sp.]
MTIGEKIQKLRKEKGLSQEQLANQLEVSRQAISKWELGESFPDINKVVLISEYFQVTTDYLIKDYSSDEEQSVRAGRDYTSNNTAINNTAMKNIILIISLTLIVIGLIVGWARGSTDGAKLEYLPFQLIAPGIIIQILGVVLFEVYNTRVENKIKKVSRCWFYGISIWFVDLLPIVIFVGRFFRYVVGSYNGIMPYLCMMVFYVIFSSIISLVCFLKLIRRK